MKNLMFRVWKGGKMIYSDDPKWNMPYEFFEQACLDFDDAMMFTGVVDKNGKEIYEGDIVKEHHFEDWNDDVGFEYRGVVYWSPLARGFRSLPEANEQYKGNEIQTDGEIVGNIYEGN